MISLDVMAKIMAYLDVKSLFTNVPVNFTIDLVLKSVFSNSITEFHGLTKFQLKTLLHWTSKGTVFQFNGQLLEQIDRVSIGKPYRSPISRRVHELGVGSNSK